MAASGLLAAALLTACGGATNGAADLTPTSAAPPASTSAAAAAYNECLTQHGVDPSTLPAGGFGGGSANASRPTGGSQPGVSRSGTRPAGLGSVPGGAANAEGSRGPRVTLDATQQAARDACLSLLPSGTGAGARNDANVQAFRLYQSCLADNGVPIVTQAPSTLGSGDPGGGFGGVDRNSPAFAAADAKCRVLLPAGAQGPGGAGAPSDTPTTSR
jgi:hypothetical protein